MIALGQAHDLLLKGVREAADLRALIAGTVSVHQSGNQFRLSGPELQIGSRAALSLALMFHELATNAAKYGALSSADGVVTIDWRVDTQTAPGRFHLSWSEHGGPPVTPPMRRGFGSRMIETGLAGQIDGAVTLDYRPAGLHCELDAPLATILQEEIHPTPRRGEE